RDVLERQLEEQVLARLAVRNFLADRGVIGGAVLDRVVEDRRIGREPGDREVVYVAVQGAVVEQIARDVVEPKALSAFMKCFGGFHRVTSFSTSLKCFSPPLPHRTRESAQRLRVLVPQADGGLREVVLVADGADAGRAEQEESPRGRLEPEPAGG